MMPRLRMLLPAVVALLFLVPTARAVDAALVRKAIDRGVVGLKRMQTADGTWPHNEIGATALAGFTLLECDVPADDTAVRKAAGMVRQAYPRITHSYSISLSILFLDRLGKPEDVRLIQGLAIRLLAGQCERGGWGYISGQPLSDEQERKLDALREKAKEGGTAKPKEADWKKEIDKILEDLPKGDPVGNEDNSNTQFAVLALWVASRHGIPIESAVTRIDKRFRDSVNADGGWAYLYGKPGELPSTPAMTCSAMVALAVSHGTANRDADDKAAKELAKDPLVRTGLLALGTCIDHPVSRKVVKHPIAIVTEEVGKAYYFLWSLERVGMIYGLETIGGKDWYNWGAEVLLVNQRPDGLWFGEYGASGADTCFALLFLKRANPARDLTRALRGGVNDPGEVVLKSGGVGGTTVPPRLKPALDPQKPGPTTSTDPKEKPVPPNPKPAPDAETAKLTTRLVEAKGERQGEMLAMLRDGRGTVYTQALAGAIPQLGGESKTKARDALAQRLTRMSSDTLGDKLDDEDLEIRRAAALAIAMKDDKKHITKLIALLEDPEVPVVRAVHAALKSLTNQDFGPGPDATRAEQQKAVAAWKAWWSKQKK